MANKEIKITVPEGYEIDKGNSTFECIKFKRKASKYESIARTLFDGNPVHFITMYGDIDCVGECEYDHLTDPNNASSAEQLARVLALNKLLNVAEYFNTMHPNNDEYLYHIVVHDQDEKLSIETLQIKGFEYCGSCLFHHFSDAKEAIEILGEGTIKLALGVI